MMFFASLKMMLLHFVSQWCDVCRKMWRSHASLGESRHHWQRQHHLPKANIIEKRRLLPQSFFSLAGAEGLGLVATTQSRGIFRLCYAPRSVAALTVHRTVIHYRSPSSPSVSTPGKTKKDPLFAYPFLFWQGQKDLNPRPMVLETSTLPTELYPYALVYYSIYFYVLQAFFEIFSSFSFSFLNTLDIWRIYIDFF